ncbi:zinc finger protein 507 [Amia ocellicauda]|uniref:zinc finger protein 507 n=1 Tax=Amia ocellicauda TaxID=2972642 RepID=UPI0034648E42
MEESSSIAVLVPHSRGQEAVLIPERVASARLQGSDGKQKQKATDSLIQVIEKLSKIVENKRPRRCTLSGKKRPHLTCPSVGVESKENFEAPSKIPKDSEAQRCSVDVQEEYCLSQDVQDSCGKTVTCYQCSLCKFISPTLTSLKDHIKEHDQQNEVILVCSECCFTSNQQEEFKAHLRIHIENKEPLKSLATNHTQELQSLSTAMGKELVYTGEIGGLPLALEGEEARVYNSEGEPVKKKWYTYEQYGMYRCLICSYTCGQQRMLKTHAWKHAGLVDCSYPIFEDELETSLVLDSAAVPPSDEAVVVLTPVSKPETLHSVPSFQFKLCASSTDSEETSAAAPAAEETSEEVYHAKVQVTEEEVVEEQMISDSEPDPGTADSLLSSAQKIISCSPNRAGHVNVIVERLPGAEETVATKPFLVNPDIEVEKRLLTEESPIYYEEDPEDFPTSKGSIAVEEVVIGWCNSDKQSEDEASKDSSVAADENVPPIRRRTHSESLRLHSLAAEALVAMPTRTPEVMKASIKSIVELSTQNPDTGQRYLDLATTSPHKVTPAVRTSAEDLTNIKESGTALVDLELQPKSKEGLPEGPVKMGISMSLLTVIEKLRERTDQNASDEDILKELQDNAQSQPNSDISLPEGNLVEYIPDTERPYRCRLCRYTSGNKGYIKQHLRVHRQRQPYQCPICDHIAEDSKDLENHMINHCKTRTYHCKQCNETFYYKSQLRNHEREQHGLPDTLTALPSVTETTATVEESEDKTADEDLTSIQKIYKCDVCDYTSATYVGVRNHRRIHNSDKPYRCCSCDFATTNMNSLKSHMRRHPQEHQAVQLMEQYRCSLCGYVCSHPPSLKSHMWKHAGDQNYNYEQVNKAINEAISQSSRSPCLAPTRTAAVESVVERPGVGAGGADKVVLDQNPSACASKDSAGRSEPTRGPSPATKVASVPEKPGSHTRAGMEYCMLLFCCCICGFESTSKERLMDHMKEHEGEIINIILNKEQSPQAAQNNT